MEFVITGDGSSTLYHPEVGEHYHSKHGALQESRHVFLETGLAFFLQKEQTKQAAVLEVGFGTGLNFLLTADYAAQADLDITYCGIEAFPLEESLIFATGYDQFVQATLWTAFTEQYQKAMQHKVRLSPNVQWQIAHEKLLDFTTEDKFDVIFFDAFAAIHQPEMWTDEALAKVCSFLKVGGVFVTYAITGNLKRSMKTLGFSVEKAPGAPGKREMLRAIKT
ncbi:tRNA (5-methylaminomethyl-2-thiouridine)(34)-methyltransferase MnmD [Sphingobacterium griseoflavum]|uniref:MnmC-like methyltransferase domain-containing protein n=1 Tax=Sphingobacterium griseoflavum TaxID=1474952 RepID=A0ABQ3HX53_9SPHI|nr:tRNA (5-methylaminomethyl-2-thiouridine)(34)-methyltransferase MnmD [Sphingobacterium griseoflavum]GHE43504.1 hypothetical protein GCM10017764_28490 [Sphingobacterium griseoflavum]